MPLWRDNLSFALACTLLALPRMLPAEAAETTSAWPQPYTVRADRNARQLILSTPYYSVLHETGKGGAISAIRLTYGKAGNLLVRPISSLLVDNQGASYSDLNDPSPRVRHTREGSLEIVTADSKLLNEQGRALPGVRVKTRFEYHWGFVKVQKQFEVRNQNLRLSELRIVDFALTPSLTHCGYREGITEQEGASPFSFGSCLWGSVTPGSSSATMLTTNYLPRYVMFADPGVEGLEWFVGSNLVQWDLQLTGRRGDGRCDIQFGKDTPGMRVSISPYRNAKPIELPRSFTYTYYLAVPILEGHTLRPWFHTSFNRNRGDWVSSGQVKKWAESGMQTVHCHNDGDYYDDGLFWRDGSYPPYPDMDKYDKVIADCHASGLRVATYFSNKELHPSTREFQENGRGWGRMNAKGNLQHNFFRGTNEFGAQMCLRSGWLGFLESSIDRVLTNHALDGVYYDWNVALLCCNSNHANQPRATAAKNVRAQGRGGEGPHWDIDELLQLMEWTRQRVGPKGLVIIHNTTTPMFATENFADHIVANEWGYGRWAGQGPELKDLPLEWSLVGARSRGVISYGQLDAKSPARLHRLFALEALLGGVSPWPASPETFAIFPVLKPIGNVETCRFADWRNQALRLEGTRCASAIYSRPGEAFLLIANLDETPQEIRCVLQPRNLPHPLASIRAASVVSSDAPNKSESAIDVQQLLQGGVKLQVSADSVVLLKVQ